MSVFKWECGAYMKTRGLLSIGEFAKLTGIPRSKLIYYDEIGLFAPAERGENNYRYYALNQIIVASFINDMASFGVPLKDLLSLAHERTPEVMIDVLDRACVEHKKEIAKLRETQSVLEVMAGLMQEGLRVGSADIEILEYQSRNLVLGGENIHQDASSFYPAWLSFMSSAKKAGLNIKYPVGGYFDSMERFEENPRMPSRYYFVNPRGKHVREGGTYLAGYVRGFYGEVKGLPEHMLAYAKEHELTLTGPVYNTFLVDEMSTNDSESYLMRASVRIDTTHDAP